MRGIASAGVLLLGAVSLYSLNLASAEDAPADVLSAKGLLKAGTQYVSAAEGEFSERMKEIRGAQKNFIDANKKVKEMEAQIEANKEEYTNLLAQRKQLNTQLPGLRGDVDKYNQGITLLNQMGVRLDELLHLVSSDGPEMKEARKEVSEARNAFVEVILGLKNTAKDAEKQYAALAGDEAVKAALEKLSSSEGKPYTLGPSRTFSNNVRSIEKYDKIVKTGDIDLRREGNSYYVSVVFNGKHSKEMIFDTGCSSVALPYTMAVAIGMKPDDNDPDVTVQIADGSTFQAKLVYAESIRVGEFEATNVACLVAPARMTEASALLGMTYLGNFNFHLDPDASKLKLTEIDDPDAKKVMKKSSKKKKK